MGRTLSRLWIAMTVLVFVVGASAPPAMDAGPPLRWPFAPGANWRFSQGYNGSTHTCNGQTCYERYGLDIAREDGKMASQPVYAMTSGEVAWVDTAHKCVSLDIGGGYFQITCHVDGVERLKHGMAVKQGDQLGVVAPAGPDNGGFAHIHIGLYKAPSWQAGPSERQPVPFAGQFAIEGTSYPADDSVSNQYVGTVVSSRLPLGATSPAAMLATNLTAPPTPIRVAAESLSAVTTVSIPLARGWNLFSVPLVPADSSPRTVLASIADKYEVLLTRDQRNGWRAYRPAHEDISDLDKIEASMGLWIKMSQPATLTVTGVPPTTSSITLTKGWNLVGYPSNRTRLVEQVFGPAVPQIERIMTYRAAEEKWYSYSSALDAQVNDLEIVAPGRGYWIYATAEATVRVAW